MANTPTAYRAVACFEAVKGVVVLAAAGLLARLLNSGTQQTVEALSRHFHMNPARHDPQVFVATVLNFGNAHLLALSVGAISYAVVRFIEAYGLWHQRAWAWGFAIISAGLYIPLELVELTRHAGWPGLTVLALNCAIVFVLWRSRKSRAG